MQRSVLSVTAVLIPGALVLACVSGSSGTETEAKSVFEKVCANYAECMLFSAGETERQCSDDKSGQIEELNKIPECMALAKAYEESYACVSDLSCEEAKLFLSPEGSAHKCNAPVNALSEGSVDACRNAAHSGG